MASLREIRPAAPGRSSRRPCSNGCSGAADLSAYVDMRADAAEAAADPRDHRRTSPGGAHSLPELDYARALRRAGLPRADPAAEGVPPQRCLVPRQRLRRLAGDRRGQRDAAPRAAGQRGRRHPSSRAADRAVGSSWTSAPTRSGTASGWPCCGPAEALMSRGWRAGARRAAAVLGCGTRDSRAGPDLAASTAAYDSVASGPATRGPSPRRPAGPLHRAAARGRARGR